MDVGAGGGRCRHGRVRRNSCFGGARMQGQSQGDGCWQLSVFDKNNGAQSLESGGAG